MNKTKLKIISAIEELGRTVTASEVCHASGLDLDICERGLNEIAMEAQGVLQVDNKGTLKYIFPRNLLTGYQQRSLSLSLITQLRFVFEVLFYFIKVAVGILLLISLAILGLVLAIPCSIIGLIAMIFGVFASASQGGGLMLPVIGNLFLTLSAGFQSLFIPKPTHPPAGIMDDQSLIPDLDERQEKSFVMDCYSFLFGDGFPNKDFEERKWKALGRLIHQNGGALIVEQMAPFLAPKGTGEALALQAVVHFNGRPQVSETGAIIYTFEEFLKNSSDDKQAPPAYLEAKRWQFTEVPFNAIWKVWMFSSLNFCGYYLLWLNRGNLFVHHFLPFTETLLIYSCAFLIFPAIRYMVTPFLNTYIDIENDLRLALASELNDPSAAIAAKLSEREKFVITPELKASDEIIYDSSKSIKEQKPEFKQEDEKV